MYIHRSTVDFRITNKGLQRKLILVRHSNQLSYKSMLKNEKILLQNPLENTKPMIGRLWSTFRRLDNPYRRTHSWATRSL